MSDIETGSQATEFRLAILGGGRLADAIAEVWLARTGETPLVWSRGGPHPSDSATKRIPDGVWVKDWADTLSARSLVIAIPGKALLEVASHHDRAKTFRGNIFSAAASLARESLQRLFPRATVTCIAPYLIDGTNSIPMLALRPAGLSDSKWGTVESELCNFGDVDVVRDDDVFSRLSLLGSAWPAVVMEAIRVAANVGVQSLPDQAAIGIGRQVFFRAIQSLLLKPTAENLGEESSGDNIATPGGITERGLKNVGELTPVLKSIFEKMQARANELRA